MRTPRPHRVIARSLAAAAIAAAAGQALAGPVEVTVTNRNGCATRPSVIYSAGASIQIDVDPCATHVRVRALDGTSDIGRVEIRGSLAPNAQLLVSVSAGAFPKTGLPIAPAGGDFGGLFIADPVTRSATVFAGGFSGDLTGSIDVGELHRLDAGGGIEQFIRAERAAATGAVITAASVSPTGHIEITSGDLAWFDIEGDIASQIVINDGAILDGLLIGGSQTDGWVRAHRILGPVHVGGTVRRIEASGEGAVMTSDLTAGTLGQAGTGIPPVSLRGFDGDLITLGDITEPLAIGDGGWAPGHVISIGGAIHARSEGIGRERQGNRMLILVDADRDDERLSSPLDGLIVLNAMNTGAPPTDANGDGVRDERDLWLGDVSIDFPTSADVAGDVFAPARDEVLIGPNRPQPYRAPYYHALPAQLGGGSIALAPFEVHPMESTPSRGEQIKGALSSATVAYYGPVIDLDGDPTTSPVRIEHAPDPLPALGLDGPGSDEPGPIWQDVTHNFDVTLAPDGEQRHVRIDGTFGPGYYRVIAVNGDDALRCDLVEGNPLVRAHAVDIAERPREQGHHWFLIRLATGAYDRDNDGEITPGDIIHWFMFPGDVNRDGETNADDLFDLFDKVFDR